DGEPRLVVLTPDLDEESQEGIELYRMSCYSGGTMEIYIEPYLPAPQLLVCGASPAAEALVKIGAAVGFNVVLIDPSATKEKFSAADVILPQVDPQTAAGSFLFAGITYYFCNAHCKNTFEKDPRKYLSTAAR